MIWGAEGKKSGELRPDAWKTLPMSRLFRAEPARFVSARARIHQLPVLGSVPVQWQAAARDRRAGHRSCRLHARAARQGGSAAVRAVILARHGTAGDWPPYAAVATSRYKPAGRASPLSGSSRSRHMPLSGFDDHSVHLQLRRDPVQARHAREQANKAFFDCGLGEHADLAALVVSELVANALCHGEGPIWTRLTFDRGDLRVEDHDGGGRPVRKHTGGDGECGRGLELLDGLIELHGGERGVLGDPAGPGKTAYVVLSLETAQACAR